MAHSNMANMPRPLGARYRLVVKARPQLPKRYIWEIVRDDPKGEVVVREVSRETFATMETAHEHGRPILLALRERVGSDSVE